MKLGLALFHPDRRGRSAEHAASSVRRSMALTIAALFAVAMNGTAREARAQGSPPSRKATVAIVDGYLIDGREGTPVAHSVVLIDGKKIVAVGTADTLKVPAGARVIDASGYTVMPGLIDAHVHLDLMGFTWPEPDPNRLKHAKYWHETYDKRYEDIDAASAQQLLMAGVTTAVDLGGEPNAQVRTRDRIARGEIPGPRMLVSCSYYANFDEKQLAETHRRKYIVNVRTVEEAEAAIAKTLACGADIVKLWGPMKPEQVKVIADAAHKKGILVTGHGSGDEDILARIRNGQDAIEHATPTNPAVIQELISRGTVLVPTAIASSVALQAVEFPGWLSDPRVKFFTPPDLWREIARSAAVSPVQMPFFGERSLNPERVVEAGKRIKALHDAGVRLVLGTDSGTPLNFHPQSTWREMELHVRFGIPAMKVISQATRLAAEYLKMSDKTGTIEPGKFADIIVVDGNPLNSMHELRNVVHVIKEGTVSKGFAYPDYRDLPAKGGTRSTGH
jgi:imidazolonepropionase-like amidohydrolase